MWKMLQNMVLKQVKAESESCMYVAFPRDAKYNTQHSNTTLFVYTTHYTTASLLHTHDTGLLAKNMSMTLYYV